MAVLARTKKWLLIEDFLNFMHPGREATDFSMASCTLLFDWERRIWPKEMLSFSGIDGRLLCGPFPGGTVLGEVPRAAAVATGLREGTPVVLGGHDYLCGALPLGAHAPGAFLDVNWITSWCTSCRKWGARTALQWTGSSWWAAPCGTPSGCRTRQTWPSGRSKPRRGRTRARWARRCLRARVKAPEGLYEPDRARTASYAERFQTYKTVYPALAPVSHAISAD